MALNVMQLYMRNLIRDAISMAGFELVTRYLAQHVAEVAGGDGEKAATAQAVQAHLAQAVAALDEIEKKGKGEQDGLF